MRIRAAVAREKQRPFAQGRFPFDRLVRQYPLDKINEAARDSEEGRVLKPVLAMAG